jgi:hypothetical protein
VSEPGFGKLMVRHWHREKGGTWERPWRLFQQAGTYVCWLWIGQLGRW